MILCVFAALSEAEVHWCTFLVSLKERLNALVEKYSKSAPDLSAWMQTAIPQGLEVLTILSIKKTSENLKCMRDPEFLDHTTHSGRRSFSEYRLVTAILMKSQRHGKRVKPT